MRKARNLPNLFADTDDGGVFVFILVCGFFIYSCFYFYISWEVTHGPQSTALITGKEYDNSGRNQQYFLSLIYPTSLSDSTYSSMQITQQQFEETSVGQRIPIRYNPSFVSQSQFADEPLSGGWQLLISVGLVVFVAYRIRQ